MGQCLVLAGRHLVYVKNEYAYFFIKRINPWNTKGNKINKKYW